jgi:hypothetical protein
MKAQLTNFQLAFATQLRNMGLCSKALDKFKEAEEQLQEASVICGQIQEDNHQEKMEFALENRW